MAPPFFVYQRNGNEARLGGEGISVKFSFFTEGICRRFDQGPMPPTSEASVSFSLKTLSRKALRPSRTGRTISFSEEEKAVDPARDCEWISITRAI